MSNINESLSRVAELLSYPQANTPPLHVRYGALIRAIQHRFNELGNSGQAWTYSTENVTVASGTDTYTIAATNFGKPLLVTTYSTEDSSFQANIPFFQVQNLAFDWDLPFNAASGFWATDSASVHSALRCAFYKSAGTNTTKVIFRPMPKAAAVYTVLYSVGNWVDSAALTDTPLLSQYHPLFEIQAALFLLPQCKWAGNDAAGDQIQRANLKESLAGELQLISPSWVDFTADIVNANMGMRDCSYSI